jgi:beta-N-acetylhexosaminidase
VVDIDYGLRDSIISKYHRSLGNKPEVITSLSQEIVRGMRSKNVIATAKHFPSQSLAAINPHEGVATSGISLAELERWDFMPYRKLIEKNLLDAVMLSHVVYKNVDPYFPASLSSIMIRNLLRKQLGYQGLVISDDLKMDAIKQRYPLDVSVVQAVNAGVDILLVTDNYERRVMDCVVDAVVAGKIPMKNIEDAYSRIMKIKTKYGILASVPKHQVEAQALRTPDGKLKKSGASKKIQTASTRGALKKIPSSMVQLAQSSPKTPH